MTNGGVFPNKKTIPKTAASLVDAFYSANKDSRVLGTFTSHQSLNNDTNSQSSEKKQRRICECDDPECSGFIDDDDDEEEAKYNGESETPRCNGAKTSSDLKEQKLPGIDFSDSKAETGGEISSEITKKKKKKKKKINNKDDHDIDGVKSKAKKRKSSGNTDHEAKKTKDLDDKYEMVFLQECDNLDEEEDVDMVENTRQSEIKVDLKPNDYISVGSVAKTGQGSGKKRMAHSSNEVKDSQITNLS